MGRCRLLALPPGVALVAALGAPTAAAGEIAPGGALDLTITGVLRFLSAYGDLDHKSLDGDGSVRFLNDPELTLDLRAVDPATGLEYGAVLELAVDTVDVENADRAWAFVRGGWGQARFGDDEGAAENMRLGGFSVAVGTGGIDGTVVDTPAVVGPFDSGDATKVVYYTSELGGLRLGIGYAPHGESDGQDLGGTQDDGADDMVEAGLAFVGSWGDIELEASAVGGLGRANSDNADRRIASGYLGAVMEFDEVSTGLGWGTEDVAGVGRSWWNAGIGYEIEPWSFSITWGRCYRCDEGDVTNLVAGMELLFVPGVAISAELSRFDDNGEEGGDGVVGVMQLAVAF